MYQWFEEYMKRFFSDRPASYKLKHEHIPKSLYKYQPISDSIRDDRLKSIKENKIWLTKAPYLNDPFDCQPTYYNEDKLRNIIKNERVQEKTGKSVDYLIDAVNQSLFMFRKNIKVACFSEDKFNMPLWGNYADNHRGICIEYDFTQLEVDNEFTKMLYPVGYDDNRYDITNILKSIISDDFKSNPYILFFLVLMKHKSWEYEKEWRVISFDFDGTTEKGSYIKCPVKPKAIYFGLNCSEKDIEEVASLIDLNKTKLCKMELHNNKYFHLKEIY